MEIGDAIGVVAAAAEAINTAIANYKSLIPDVEDFASKCNLGKDEIETWGKRTPDLDRLVVGFMRKCNQALESGKSIRGEEQNYDIRDGQHNLSTQPMLKRLRVISEGLFEARRVEKMIKKKRKSILFKCWLFFRAEKLGRNFAKLNEALDTASREHNEALNKLAKLYEVDDHLNVDYQLNLLKEAGHTEAIKFWQSLRCGKEVDWLQFWSDYHATYLKDSSTDDGLKKYEQQLQLKLTNSVSNVVVGVFRAKVVNDLGFPFDLSKLTETNDTSANINPPSGMDIQLSTTKVQGITVVETTDDNTKRVDSKAELETYLKNKNWPDLLPKLTASGVMSLKDLEDKVDADYIKMGIPASRAQDLTNELSFLKTPVSKKLKSAGFGVDYCRKLYRNEYHTLEAAALKLNEGILEALGIPVGDGEKVLKLFHKYAVYISHSHTPARGAAGILYDRLEVEFKKDPIFHDFHVLQDTTQLREHIQYSKTMLLLLSKEYFENPYCILEMVEAFNANIPICPCIVDSEFTKDMLAHPEAAWKKLKPFEQYTGQEFLRLARINLSEFIVVMEYLQKRNPLEFNVGINPDVQDGQFRSIVKAVKKCHEEYTKRPNPLANT